MIRKVALLFTVVMGLILSVTYVASGSSISASLSLQELPDRSAVGSGLSESYRTMAAVDPCDVDFDGSGVVDVGDIMLVAECWRMTDNDPDWDPRYDLDGDGIITVVDIMLVAAQWGNPCPTTLPPYGVQLLGGESIPAVLSLAQEAGIEWVRMYLSWSSIEPNNTTPDNYNWGGYDTKFTNLADAGLTPVVTVEGNPSWASSKSNGPIYPDKLDDFAEFVGALVAHYSVPPYNVKYWEFYNEPDNWDRWGGNGDDYGAMLKEAWEAVHGADPYGKVVFGGLSYDWWSSCPPGGCYDLNLVPTVLDTLQGESCFPCVDVWNYHFYRGLSGNWSPPTVVGKGLHLQNRLPVELQDMPFVCTEIGHPWAGSNPSNPDPPYTHENAAEYVVQAFEQTRSALNDYGLNLWGSAWFTMRYYHGGEGNYWGLVSSSLDPYPAYYAYQTMTQELAEAE